MALVAIFPAALACAVLLGLIYWIDPSIIDNLLGA